MALYKDVEFEGVGTVRVYHPPYMRIAESVKRRLPPEPQPPVIVETNKAGSQISGPPLLNDPEYLQAHAEWQAQFDEMSDEMGSLFMFQDEKVPDDWQIPEASQTIMLYYEPDWKPREGAIGRKLDYIQWHLFLDARNVQRVTKAMQEMAAIDLEEVAANEASFRGQMERKAD